MSALADMAAALTDGALTDRLAIVRDHRRSLTPEEAETYLNEAIARLTDGSRAQAAHAAGYRKGVDDTLALVEREIQRVARLQVDGLVARLGAIADELA